MTRLASVQIQSMPCVGNNLGKHMCAICPLRVTTMSIFQVSIVGKATRLRLICLSSIQLGSCKFNVLKVGDRWSLRLFWRVSDDRGSL